ncbi:MAG: hypothetical protein HY070_10190, partial [Chloroflexi bacterium]|nr:hypothetical protein [Chloroflexota bacterium]
MSRVRSAQLFPALFLILFGALLLANNLGWFIFRWEQLWAIIFIALGVWLVWRGLYPRQTESRDEMLWGFGEYAPDLANKTIQHESFRHGFGEMDLDFTRA